MNLKNLEERLKSLTEEFNKNNVEINNHVSAVDSIKVRQHQLNGAIQVVTDLIKELREEENNGVQSIDVDRSNEVSESNNTNN